jgi:hypothetical protein
VNASHDREHDIRYLIPAARQLTEEEAALAVELSRESAIERELAEKKRCKPEMTEEEQKEERVTILTNEAVPQTRRDV